MNVLNSVTQSLGTEGISAMLFIHGFVHIGKMSSETLNEKLE